MNFEYFELNPSSGTQPKFLKNSFIFTHQSEVNNSATNRRLIFWQDRLGSYREILYKHELSRLLKCASCCYHIDMQKFRGLSAHPNYIV